MRRARGRARSASAFSILAGLLLTAFAATAAAQAPEMRFARQFSMGYLQFNLMEKHQLLEKHAKAAGIPEVKVVWATFNSPAAMNDALHAVGTIKVKPADWKELFFPEIHGLPGS